MNIWKENIAKEKNLEKALALSTFPFNELAFHSAREMHRALFLHKPQPICSEMHVQHYLIKSCTKLYSRNSMLVGYTAILNSAMSYA